MNYRHAFHAGNFADVLKHAALTRILVHLRAKAPPFRVIDIHAGAGRYDLQGPQASRSGEWRQGIGRIVGAPLPEPAAALLSPYLDAVRALNPGSNLSVYPGSPLLVRSFLRDDDRLIACELEPEAAAALSRHLAGDRRCKSIVIDAYMALNAFIPPKERRGLVIIDPPFEQADEFSRVEHALAAAHRKWRSGIYLLWYPIKDARNADSLARKLRKSGIAKMLRSELVLSPAENPERLHACGLIIINPPWRLQEELRELVPALAAAFADGRGGSDPVVRIAAEN